MRFQHPVLVFYQQNGQHGSNYNKIQYWIPLFLPLGSLKLDTDIPLFFSKIQYLPLLTITLLIIMRKTFCLGYQEDGMVEQFDFHVFLLML